MKIALLLSVQGIPHFHGSALCLERGCSEAKYYLRNMPITRFLANNNGIWILLCCLHFLFRIMEHEWGGNAHLTISGGNQYQAHARQLHGSPGMEFLAPLLLGLILFKGRGTIASSRLSCCHLLFQSCPPLHLFLSWVCLLRAYLLLWSIYWWFYLATTPTSQIVHLPRSVSSDTHKKW